MRPFEFRVLPAPELLRDDVACIRIAEYHGDAAFSVKVALTCLPGIVLQHHHGRSPVQSIVTPSRRSEETPPLYLYGQVTEPSEMHHFPGPYTMTQIVLKPHALHTLFGLNAAALTNGAVELREIAPLTFPAAALQAQLLETTDQAARIDLLARFLLTMRQAAPARDALVEQSLRLIDRNIGAIQVRMLHAALNISERHFERRFRQVVGVSPQFYLRVRRFNEAVRLLKAHHSPQRNPTKMQPKMSEVAQALNFHDEAHFSRDVKAFAGLTPKHLAQKEDGFDHMQMGYFYV